MIGATLRRLSLALVLALSATAAVADGLEDSVLAQLRQQGFVEFQVSHTLLGRLHIIALGPEYRREIVINPHSGEVLRDYLTTLTGGPVTPLLVIPGQNRDLAGDGNDDPDDDDDDDDADDHDGNDDADHHRDHGGDAD